MPVNIHGTTGITTPGMESSAMPTVGGDAVVESGSNSDGEWTRWADGTQVVNNATLVLAFANSSTLTYLWTFPVEFIAIPVCFNQPRATPPSPQRSTTHYANSLTDQSTTLTAISENTPYSSGDTLNITAQATGRWK